MNTPFNLRISNALHDAIKQSSTGSMSKTVNAALLKATIDDVVIAIKYRYNSETLLEEPSKGTTALVSDLTRQNIDVIALKTGIPRDTVVRLILETLVRTKNEGQIP